MEKEKRPCQHFASFLFPPSSVMQTEMKYPAFPISSNFALDASKVEKYFTFRNKYTVKYTGI